jgi:hypothetical protein
LHRLRDFLGHRVSAIVPIGLSGRWDPYLLSELFDWSLAYSIPIVDVKPPDGIQSAPTAFEAFRHRYFPSVPVGSARALLVCAKENAPRFGKAGENSTIWDSPSPKFIMGGSDEDKYDHPTQKPVELMRRPILNHLRRGELVYEPFLGSGTTLAAAELTERVCYGIELDPKYVDVVIERWQQLTGKQATLDGNGRTFDEIAQERRGWDG